MKKIRKRILALLMMTLLFTIPMLGCNTTKLDNLSQKQEKSDDWMEKEEEAEKEEETEKEEKEASDTDEYLE